MGFISSYRPVNCATLHVVAHVNCTNWLLRLQKVFLLGVGRELWYRRTLMFGHLCSEFSGLMLTLWARSSRICVANCARYFFGHLKDRGIVQESPIYHRVERSLLYQNPLSVKSEKFPFARFTNRIVLMPACSGQNQPRVSTRGPSALRMIGGVSSGPGAPLDRICRIARSSSDYWNCWQHASSTVGDLRTSFN